MCSELTLGGLSELWERVFGCISSVMLGQWVGVL